MQQEIDDEARTKSDLLDAPITVTVILSCTATLSFLCSVLSFLVVEELSFFFLFLRFRCQQKVKMDPLESVYISTICISSVDLGIYLLGQEVI